MCDVRYRFPVGCSLLKEAADVAFEFGDENGLRTVQHAAKRQQNAAVVEHAGKFIALLSSKK